MARNVSIEVPSLAERNCTGYAGAVIYEARGVKYRVELWVGGKIRDATRNGERVAMHKWPSTAIKQLARTAAIYFPPA